MEVHHHPDLHHKKKNFKEYFLEFLMIFLAVTMGFFAEGIRENISNHKREIDFVHSMVEDLKSDTANINSFTAKANEAIDEMDSLMHLMRRPDRGKYGQTMYYFSRAVTTKVTRFQLNERTYEEMKSSGSLGLIESKELSDSISNYYAKQTHFKEQADLQLQKLSAYTDFAGKVFDGAIFQQMMQRFPYKVVMPKGNPHLLTSDHNIINEFVGLLHYYCAISIINTSYAEQEKDVTIHLIKIIEDKYHLQ
jgi:hypothetical protein